MTPRYARVFLDLDGTLVDSGPAIVRAFREACAEVGSPLDASVDLAFVVGPPLERSLGALLPEPELVSRAAAAYRAIFARVVASSGLNIMPGADEAVQRIRAGGATLAVVTYKVLPLAEQVLRSSGLLPAIDVVVGRRDSHDARSKTDLLTEALASVPPFGAPAVYVGDHAEDAMAARDAEVDFVAYGTGADWASIVRAIT